VDVIKEISPNERVFEDSFAYFQHALDGLRIVEEALGQTEPRRILDYPCGHGRVLRALRARYPQAEIVAADIVHDGVDFCARTFGAVPVYAERDPAQTNLQGPFDLVWVGSLLTHLDAPWWDRFLSVFQGLGGTLVFTTHGDEVARRIASGRNESFVDDDHGLLREYEETGFSYRAFPMQTDYGISLSSSVWVNDLLEHHPWRFDILEADWSGYQDVVVCRRG
jgi:SAM-dependent methyltransferase